jgi:mono/diheme cytochrome c family protein
VKDCKKTVLGSFLVENNQGITMKVFQLLKNYSLQNYSGGLLFKKLKGTACLVLFTSTAFALPFNQDMVGGQLSVGDIHRPEPENSKQRGAESRYSGETREGAAGLTNPVPATAASVHHGERLYQANCSMCHGRRIDGKQVEGGVQHLLPGIPLFEAYMKEKPDAHYFQFVKYGGMAIMPAYGWKFSTEEIWDIVNYIRLVQKEVSP